MAKSINGKEYPLLSEAIAGGLFHPNCRHTATTWIEGVTQLPKPLDPKEIRRTAKLEQRQRELEREIRRAKRACECCLNGDDKKLRKKELQQKQAELRQFIAENDDVLRRDYWREKTYGEKPHSANEHVFYTKDDPIRESLGSAFSSHPVEMQTILSELEQKGVAVQYRDNTMGYQPSPTVGKSGQIVMDKDASYSAWIHEMQHVHDDEKSGWLGFRNFVDTEKAVLFEARAYGVEIAFAEKLGYNDIVTRLKTLKEERIREVRGE